MTESTAGAVPMIHLSGERSALLGREALERDGGAALLEWLGRQRWYSRRDEARALEVRELLPLEPGGRLVLAVLSSGGSDWLAPLELRDGGDVTGAIARVVARDGEGILADASASPALHAAIVRLLRGESTVAGIEAERLVAPEHLPAATTRAKVGSAEQSNTSLVFGDRAIVKLFRRLEEGENPDVEIGRVLGGAHPFEGTPRLLGVLSLTGEAHRTIAIAQELVVGARDAWAVLLDVARPAVDPGSAGGSAAMERAEALAHGLGRLTRLMHAALAQAAHVPGFEARVATGEDVARWGAGARARVREALDRLAAARGAGGVPEGERGRAERLLAHREEVERRVERIAAMVGEDAGGVIRHHGDYHLGQVIVGDDGRLYAIDFEGEPARPLAERRAPSSPLRDVAGMLRSFAYLGGTLAREHAGDVRASRHAAELEGRLRERFLVAYMDGEDAATMALPVTPAASRALIDLFEVEKVFYEISYELGHRPEWVGIPLAGAAHAMLGADGGGG